MVSDLIGGHVDWGVLSVPSVQGHLKSGALRAIGVGTQTRIPGLPDVPSMAEQGMPNRPQARIAGARAIAWASAPIPFRTAA